MKEISKQTKKEKKDDDKTEYSSFRGKKEIPQYKIKYIWEINFKNKIFPNNIRGFILTVKDYIEYCNKLLYSRYIVDCAKAEWGEELKPNETTGFTLPNVEMDGKEIYLIIIKENSDIDITLKHELEHIYNNEFYIE